MSLVISVQRSLPWAQACDEDRGSSRSDASSNASIVAIVCSSNSRTAPRTVAAIGSSRRAEGGYGSALPLRSREYQARQISERARTDHCSSVSRIPEPASLNLTPTFEVVISTTTPFWFFMITASPPPNSVHPAPPATYVPEKSSSFLRATTVPFAVPHAKPASPTENPLALTGYLRPRYVKVPEPQLNPIPAATEPCDSSSVAAGIQSCARAGPTSDTRTPSTSAITS